MESNWYQRWQRDQRCDGYADGYKAGRADKLLGQNLCISRPSDIGYSGRYAMGYAAGQRATQQIV